MTVERLVARIPEHVRDRLIVLGLQLTPRRLRVALAPKLSEPVQERLGIALWRAASRATSRTIARRRAQDAAEPGGRDCPGGPRPARRRDVNVILTVWTAASRLAWRLRHGVGSQQRRRDLDAAMRRHPSRRA